MQVILGSGGAIGIELAKALPAYTDKIRLVSRNPKKVNESDELFPADVLNAEHLAGAVTGASVVYVTVGFTYSLKVWQHNWPLFIDNLLAACEKEGCRLVFFDNIYMYDQAQIGHMTEETPINPPSKKGAIRAQIAKTILDKHREGKVKALIARSADFYGPSIQKTSMLTELIFIPFSKGKSGNWLASDGFKHSFTYTPDAAKATALLGNTESAYGEVWHLPTAANPFTAKELIAIIAGKMGAKPKYRVLPKTMLKLLGWFVPVLGEMVEMLYQYDRDYVFDSSKFEKRFGIQPTAYEEGIQQIIQTDYS